MFAPAKRFPAKDLAVRANLTLDWTMEDFLEWLLRTVPHCMFD